MATRPGYFLSRGAASEVAHFLGTYHGDDDHACEVVAALYCLLNGDGPIALLPDIDDDQPIAPAA
jgi:hypothetical protein